jgi:hypothetical protein
MTAEEFAEAVDKLIEVARDGGVSDGAGSGTAQLIKREMDAGTAPAA